MQDFRNLRAWQGAHACALLVYRLTARFPPSEAFGLSAQLRSAAVSVGANMAEACGRGTDVDARRHFQMAMGSASELLSHALLAGDLGFLSADEFAQLEHERAPVRRCSSA